MAQFNRLGALYSTIGNLRQQKNKPGTDAIGPGMGLQQVQGETTKAKEAATQQIQQKAQQAAGITKPGTLAVDMTAYNPQESKVQGDIRGNYNEAKNSITAAGGAEQATNRVIGAMEDVNRQRDAAIAELDPQKQKDIKALQEQQTAATNQLADLYQNYKSPEVAAQNQLEQQSMQQNQALASLDPRSNIGALALLTGQNYDPRFATLLSGVYQGDVDRARGIAQQQVAQAEGQEKAKESALASLYGQEDRGRKQLGEQYNQQLAGIDSAIAGLKDYYTNRAKGLTEGYGDFGKEFNDLQTTKKFQQATEAAKGGYSEEGLNATIGNAYDEAKARTMIRDEMKGDEDKQEKALRDRYNASNPIDENGNLLSYEDWKRREKDQESGGIANAVQDVGSRAKLALLKAIAGMGGSKALEDWKAHQETPEQKARREEDELQDRIRRERLARNPYADPDKEETNYSGSGEGGG